MFPRFWKKRKRWKNWFRRFQYCILLSGSYVTRERTKWPITTNRYFNEFLLTLGNSRRLNQFLKTQLDAKQDLVSSLLNLNHPFITTDGKVYLRGVSDRWVNFPHRILNQIRIARMEEKVAHTKDSLNNLMNMYMAKISLEMNQLSNQVNNVTKTFRWENEIILWNFQCSSNNFPSTFISCIFGMIIMWKRLNKIVRNERESSRSRRPNIHLVHWNFNRNEYSWTCCLVYISFKRFCIKCRKASRLSI